MSVVPHAVAMRSSTASRLGAYVALTKPRIIELLLVTTLPAMLLAAHGMPAVGVLTVTLVCGAGAAASANMVNCYLDRDIDKVMHRTAGRRLDTPEVHARGVLLSAVVLGATSVVGLWLATNLLAAALTAAAIAMYVVGYTLLLKRRTPSNIVWGGSAGCMPTLIGWAAVTGRLSWTPLVLFAIVFFWTPPHFWALAMKFRTDYAAAGVPMLPVVAPPEVVVSRMSRYGRLTVLSSLALAPVAATGPVYPVAAAVLGAMFLREIGLLRRQVSRGEAVRPLRVFHWSITYLSLLFSILSAETLLRSWL